mmetsp:Transcript_20475/g.28769  ORF Transcript_20475/g.28769 Transcript_20475/m.28769 type:complete len:98 (-) Transcript_20475:151-444(-)
MPSTTSSLICGTRAVLSMRPLRSTHLPSSNSLLKKLAEMIVEMGKVAVVVLHCFRENVLVVRRDEASHCLVSQIRMFRLTLRVNLEEFPLDLAALIS